MKIKDEGCTVVIIGNWNTYILSPQWVAKNIFETDKIQVEFALNLGLPPRYSTAELRLVPTDSRITLFALSYSDTVFADMVNITKKLADKLPYTPVTGFGINFSFTESSDKANLNRLFDFPDTKALSDFGCVIKDNSIRRGLIVDNKVLNLKIGQDGDKISFDLNFHYEVKSASEIGEKIDGAVVANKNIALSLLKSVYDLDYELEEEVVE